jgi:drug/metabolite transporter (DMT)-like permease
VIFLSDELSGLAWIGLAIIVTGLFSLAGPARGRAIAAALAVAATIGIYSVSDAKGVRVAGTDRYVLAEFAAAAICVTVYGVAARRTRSIRIAMATRPRTSVVSGIALAVTYGLVVAAFRRAPVGYVTALRESSVVLAALAGWKLLGEPAGRLRVASAVVVVAGVVVLVIGR